MNAESSDMPVGRVVAAFDATLPKGDFWKLAVRLAGEMRSELRGLFVEDERLLQVSELPEALEFGTWSAGGRPMSLAAMQRALRNAAVAARRSLSLAAEEARLRWSFETVRGSLLREALRGLEQADLLLTAPGRGSTPTGWAAAGTILIAYDGTESANRALEAAVRASSAANACIAVLLIAATDAESDELKRKSADFVRDAAGHVAVFSRRIGRLDECVEIARRWGARLLLVGRDCVRDRHTELSALSAELPCPLGVVR